MTFGDSISDPDLLRELLVILPVGRRVYQPSTGRNGFIANQDDFSMAPDGTYTKPWHQCFYQQMNWKIVWHSDPQFGFVRLATPFLIQPGHHHELDMLQQ